MTERDRNKAAMKYAWKEITCAASTMCLLTALSSQSSGDVEDEYAQEEAWGFQDEYTGKGWSYRMSTSVKTAVV